MSNKLEAKLILYSQFKRFHSQQMKKVRVFTYPNYNYNK